MKPDNTLRTPQASEGVYLAEACRHRRLLRMLEDHFTSWGYQPVLTPVFDYFETYRALLDTAQVERSYRFTDREGELLMLRSDITLFLARQMGMALPADTEPQRLYYADSIIRHQEEEDISSDEFFQAGAELIGLSGREADLEVLLLLYSLLTPMALPAWRMHIGSKRLLDALGEGRTDASAIGKLASLRDKDALVDSFTQVRLTAAEERARLLLFIGTLHELTELTEQLAPALNPLGEVNAALKETSALIQNLSAIVPPERIRIDLSEHGGQPYYTGFTVSVYVEGASAAVVSGGRYDQLLKHFGSHLPAAGFSLLTRKIEPLSGYASQFTEEARTSPACGESFSARYKNAVERRQHGEKVTLI
ncbi:MAG: hypothetical protein B0D92_06380 [Spirochaeta sp. LUC14_002_19_P3]|nr:MAG: hypothetical protein B0D92_06380 [Spirochaeta sp. LUC14_002_19_P3]